MARRLKMSIDGTLGFGERFSLTVHFTDPATTPSPDDVQAWAVAAGGILQNHNSNRYFEEMSSSAAVRSVRTYWYAATGGAAMQGGAPLTTAVVGAGAIAAPFQCARVATLITARAGRRYRGRIYIPCLRPPMVDTGKTGPYTAGEVAQLADLLADLGTAFPNQSVAPAVYSAVADEVTPVTAVRIGDVVDTQRRRRDALVESYVSAPI